MNKMHPMILMIFRVNSVNVRRVMKFDHSHNNIRQAMFYVTVNFLSVVGNNGWLVYVFTLSKEFLYFRNLL